MDVAGTWDSVQRYLQAKWTHEGRIECQGFCDGFRTAIASDDASVQVGFLLSVFLTGMVTCFLVGIQPNIQPSKMRLKNNQQHFTQRQDYGMTGSSSLQTHEMS